MSHLARLVLLAMLAGCAELPATGTDALAQTGGDPLNPSPPPAIVPPSSALERPARVYVLPVFWIPADQAGVVRSDDFQRAKANLAAHLQVARTKYEYMLRSPVDFVSRGTFGLASWDATAGHARVHTGGALEPLVVSSSSSYDDFAWQPDNAVVAEVVDAAGCELQSCPFVFVIVIAGQSSTKIGGVAFNYGSNGGGGYLRMPMSAAKNGDDATSRLQSTLLHELGHTFSLQHLDDAYEADGVTHLKPPACDEEGEGPCELPDYEEYCGEMDWARRKFEHHCSPSVMSYSWLNRTAGCVAVDANGWCQVPADPWAVFWTVKGLLLPENVRHLARNELVFPELAAAFDILTDDDDGDLEMQYHMGNGAPDDPDYAIPGHDRMRASANSVGGSTGRSAFGYHGKHIDPVNAPFDGRRMWKSADLGYGGWGFLTFDFPELVQLGRVRVFTGHGANEHRATHVVVIKGEGASAVTCGAATVASGRGDVDVNLSTTGACTWAKGRYQVRVTAGTSGRVVVRGVRFFRPDGAEVQGPREPIAATTDTHGGYPAPVANVIGSEQWIVAYSHPWTPGRMWHSRAVGEGQWVWIDVRLPDLMPLHSVAVYTGHSATWHAAQRVRVRHRDADGVYQQVADAPVGSSQWVDLDGGITHATHLRLGFQAGPSGHVVVRGIRLFTAQGEAFTPRFNTDPLLPLY